MADSREALQRALDLAANPAERELLRDRLSDSLREAGIG
jgi:predicted RNA polymerase sigma factor